MILKASSDYIEASFLDTDGDVELFVIQYRKYPQQVEIRAGKWQYNDMVTIDKTTAAELITVLQHFVNSEPIDGTER